MQIVCGVFIREALLLEKTHYKGALIMLSKRKRLKEIVERLYSLHWQAEKEGILTMDDLIMLIPVTSVVDAMAVLLITGLEPKIGDIILKSFISMSDATKTEATLIRLYARFIRKGRNSGRVRNRINSTLKLDFNHIPTPRFRFDSSSLGLGK